MGLGNQNPKNGDKGSSYSYELRHLRLLGAIRDAVGAGGGSDATAANQATQITVANQILAQLQSVDDIEIKLVKDTVTGDYYIYSLSKDGQGNVSVVYYDVAGAVIVPPNPVEFVDPTFYLQLATWDNIPGNSKEINYGTVNGAKEVTSIVYKTGIVTVATQTLAYDIDNDVTSITAV